MQERKKYVPEKLAPRLILLHISLISCIPIFYLINFVMIYIYISACTSIFISNFTFLKKTLHIRMRDQQMNSSCSCLDINNSKIFSTESFPNISSLQTAQLTKYGAIFFSQIFKIIIAKVI